MSLFIRRLFFALTGLLAGLLAWPFVEIIIYYQAGFPSLLLFSTTLGMAIGLLMGGVFGTSEGIITNSRSKLKKGIVMGMLVGALGGIIGFITGQAALLFIGTTLFNSATGLHRFGLPLSKAVGWSVFGIFLGLAEGVRSRSWHKARNGIIGGLLGGLAGGLVVEYLNIFFPNTLYSRVAGLMLLGTLIGVFYGFIEKRLAEASLLLLNGLHKGKEFLLTQKRTTLGSSSRADIEIRDYQGVADIHSAIKKDKKDFILTHVQDDPAVNKTVTFINDGKALETKLSDGDVVRIGSAQFQFRTLLSGGKA